MSTKIYNGFRMKNISGNEIVTFLNELREKIKPEINKAFCEGLTMICRKIIYNAIQYDLNFNDTKKAADEVEGKFLRSWYLSSLTTTSAAQRALYDIDKVIEDLDWPFVGGILNLAINVYRNDTLNESKVSCYNDIRSEIAFCKGDDTHLLFITYGNVFTDYLDKLIQNKDELITKYGIEEYGYWNNTDKPEGITDEDWVKRESDWNKALPGMGVTARCGLCTTNIINDEDLFSIMKMGDDGRTKLFFEHFPEDVYVFFTRDHQIIIIYLSLVALKVCLVAAAMPQVYKGLVRAVFSDPVDVM